MLGQRFSRWHYSHLVPQTDFTAHDNIVTDIAIAPNQHLISASIDETLKIWHLKTRQLLYTLPGHAKGVTCLVLKSRW
uniref:WD40 repeat domain-containing protein n=1 Tax=Desertifilum tharense IPPAS B-1220 TaxID=1781255 RepID=A0ACD5GSQ0_9CYAN